MRHLLVAWHKISSYRVRVFEDLDGLFHFQAYEAGRAGGRNEPALCGADIEAMREAAWFPVGDARGLAHYDRACAECREQLQ